MNIRRLAVEILTKTEEKGAYSNLLLRKGLDEHRPESRDAALLTEIVYGTIQHQSRLDIYLDELITKGLASVAPWLRACLRMSMYQLLFLDKVPEHAVVHEAVEIAKDKGHLGIAKLVNGVLREAIRRKSGWHLKEDEQHQHDLAKQFAMPEWLVDMWSEQYGETCTADMCRSLNQPPHTSLRVNRMRADRAKLILQMKLAGWHAKESPLAADGIVLHKAGNMANTEWFRQGLVSIQDESSMMVAHALDVGHGMQVLDCCAAPGGKTAHLAELMRDSGRILAVDIHPHKQKLIQRQMSRLGVRSVEVRVADAMQLRKQIADESFDRILLDAPCSGLGVIRRKPDIKWSKTPEDLVSIPALQFELLHNVASLLKKGGLLVYSTCSLNMHENEHVIQQFLKVHSGFELADEWSKAFSPALLEKIRISSGMLRIWPHTFASDGFFIAKIKRKL